MQCYRGVQPMMSTFNRFLVLVLINIKHYNITIFFFLMNIVFRYKKSIHKFLKIFHRMSSYNKHREYTIKPNLQKNT